MDDKVRVVFVGGFGSGRTHLLSALLHQGKVEDRLGQTTSIGIPTRIVDGINDNKIYIDGESESVPAEKGYSLAEFREKYCELEEELSDAFFEKIRNARATIRCPLRNPFYEFMEVPLADYDFYGEFISDILIKTDAIVFTINATQPLSNWDVRVLEMLMCNFGEHFQEKCFLAVTFCDILKKNRVSVEKVENYIRQKLKNVFGETKNYDCEMYKTRMFFVGTGDFGYTVDLTKVDEITGVREFESALYNYMNKVLLHKNRHMNVLADIIDQLPDDNKKIVFREQLFQIRKKISDSELKLAVIGNFSCGKSTFLNAVFGRPLLSASDLPTTAIPTYIRWDGEDRAENEDPLITAYMHTGEKYILVGEGIYEFERMVGKTLPRRIGKLIDYVTTTNILMDKIKKIEISFPVQSRYRNFCLIDTPGVNPGDEESKNHILQTQSVLREEADAAIILYPAKDAMSKDMERFMEENAAHLLGDAIVLLTKMDIVPTEREREKIILRTKKLVAQRFGQQEPVVYGISASEALEYGCGCSPDETAGNWHDKFAADMESVFGSLGTRRNELISKQAARLLNVLVNAMKEQISEDTDRLKKEEWVLRTCSLENLRKHFADIADEYQKRTNDVYEIHKKSAGMIVSVHVQKGEEQIFSQIDAQTSVTQLKSFIKEECPRIMEGIDQDITHEIELEMERGAQALLRRYADDVDTCLTKFQRKIGEINTNFRLFSPKSLAKDISMPNLNDYSFLTGSNLTDWLLPLLILGLCGMDAIGIFYLSMKKKNAKEKMHTALTEYAQKVLEENIKSIENMKLDSLKWEKDLLKTYEQQYRDLFDAVEQEWQNKSADVIRRIETNQKCLSDLEKLQTA